MQLLIVYVVLVIVGELLAAAAGYYIERTVPAASLPVFLAMFFSVLVIEAPPSDFVTCRNIPRTCASPPRSPFPAPTDR